MKNIGLIDYYISEWHANNYPAWIAEHCEKAGLDFKITHAWAELDVSKKDGKTTAQWCAENRIEQCASIRELCEKTDFVIILAPSDPDRHLDYALEAFRCAEGKRMYIDKTFAPDLATAEQIFAAAKEHGVEFFSTSALRYADELTPYRGVSRAEIFGGGSNFDEYIVHQVEMLVLLMGTDAMQLRVIPDGDARLVEVAFGDGRIGTMQYEKAVKFQVNVEQDGKRTELAITSDYFRTLMARILAFFGGENVDFPAEQTLEVMRIREAAIKAASSGSSEWVRLR